MRPLSDFEPQVRAGKSAASSRSEYMKNILALVAIGLLLSACETGPKIRANTAPNADLNSYKTYSFPAKLGTDRGDVQTPLTGYFKEAVRREMDARGYQYVDGGTADLWVNFHA